MITELNVPGLEGPNPGDNDYDWCFKSTSQVGSPPFSIPLTFCPN
jgi:hypothetical protein